MSPNSGPSKRWPVSQRVRSLLGSLLPGHVRKSKGQGAFQHSWVNLHPGAQNPLSILFQGGPFPPDGLPLYFTLTSVVRFRVFQTSSLRALVLGRTAEQHPLRTLSLCRGQLSDEPHQVLSMAVFSHDFKT